MEAEEVRRIREKLEMTREEFADLLCLSGYRTMMNIETGFRKPAKFTIRVLRYIDSLSKPKAKDFIKELSRHDAE